MARVRRSRRCSSGAGRLSIRLAGAREVDSVSGVSALVSACPRMRSELFGGHDPQLGDGGVAGAGAHVGDAVGDVLGGEDIGLVVGGSIISLRTWGLLCEPSS